MARKATKKGGAAVADTKPAPRARKPTAKAKASASASKKAKNEQDDDSSEDSADEIKPGEKVPDLDWRDPLLSEELLALITEDENIKRALYPPCGANASTAKGGGKTKAPAHWTLFVKMFGERDEYKDAVAACKTAKEKSHYGNKIKNRLSTMAKISRAYDKEMGQTGAGIHDASHINMNETSAFTSKWTEISAVCPWYFEMRNLILQRPNLRPVGLGHGSSGFEADVIVPGPAAVDVKETVDVDDQRAVSSPLTNWTRSPSPSLETTLPEARKRPYSDFGDSDREDQLDSDNDDELLSPADLVAEVLGGGDGGRNGVDPAPVVKSKAQEKARKTTAKPNTSKPVPAAPAAPKPSKKTKIAEFSELAKDEERTRQKELELAALRTKQQTAALEYKGRLVAKREERRREKEKGKQAERMMKLRLKEQRMRQDFELRMAKAKAGASTSTSHAATLSDNGSHSSTYPPSEFDLDYSTLDFPHTTAASSSTLAGSVSSDIEFSGTGHLGAAFDAVDGDMGVPLGLYDAGQSPRFGFSAT